MTKSPARSRPTSSTRPLRQVGGRLDDLDGPFVEQLLKSFGLCDPRRLVKTDALPLLKEEAQSAGADHHLRKGVENLRHQAEERQRQQRGQIQGEGLHLGKVSRLPRPVECQDRRPARGVGGGDVGDGPSKGRLRHRDVESARSNEERGVARAAPRC